MVDVKNAVAVQREKILQGQQQTTAAQAAQTQTQTQAQAATQTAQVQAALGSKVTAAAGEGPLDFTSTSETLTLSWIAFGVIIGAVCLIGTCCGYQTRKFNSKDRENAG